MNLQEQISKIKSMMGVINESYKDLPFKDSFNYKINDSKIHGKGVFANEKLNPGDRELVFIMKPDKSFLYTELGRYINHSKTPNVVVFTENDKVFIKVLKNIDLDEEIVTNYFPNEDLKTTINQKPFDGYDVTPTNEFGDKIKYLVKQI